MERQVARLAQLRARGKYQISHLRHGAAYWALSARAIDVILERHETDQHFRESFEFSAIPEEQYYHTILGESDYDARTAPFMFMDFSKDPRPFVYSTRTELLELQQRKQLFARKIRLDAPEVAQFLQELGRG
jgi:hypothetical protein